MKSWPTWKGEVNSKFAIKKTRCLALFWLLSSFGLKVKLWIKILLVHMCVCVHARVYVCMCACVYVCMRACTCVHVRMRVCVHAHMCVCARAHAYARTSSMYHVTTCLCYVVYSSLYHHLLLLPINHNQDHRSVMDNCLSNCWPFSLVCCVSCRWGGHWVDTGSLSRDHILNNKDTGPDIKDNSSGGNQLLAMQQITSNE